MPKKEPLYPHVPKSKSPSEPIATEMTIYNDGKYRVTLKANGQYTIEEYEPERKCWYVASTGDNKYMRQIAQEYHLYRLLNILT